MKAFGIPIRPWRPVYTRGLIGIVLILLVGLWLGSPPSGGRSAFDQEEAVNLQSSGQSATVSLVQAALKSLYQRQAWSIAEFEGAHSAEADQGEQAAPPPPEGLDRFELVGIIRMNSAPPEALIRDNGQADRPIKSQKAGEQLAQSDVRLEEIGSTSVIVSLDSERRTLTLFPRPDRTGSQAELEPEASAPNTAGDPE